MSLNIFEDRLPHYWAIVSCTATELLFIGMNKNLFKKNWAQLKVLNRILMFLMSVVDNIRSLFEVLNEPCVDFFLIKGCVLGCMNDFPAAFSFQHSEKTLLIADSTCVDIASFPFAKMVSHMSVSNKLYCFPS